ncbi:MAG TPA: class I SAM-dependent methyltransferase [Rickettsiales bacterium]|nr:class I SAM-dependent methyltransferase [Rickettsiales bacterium]
MQDSPASQVRTIRPKVVFGEIEARNQNTNVSFKVNIPPTGIGGLTLLESSILVSLYKLCKPREIFEFGTYLGASTLLLAENSESDVKVTTLDIDTAALPENQSSGQDILHNADDNDAFLRRSFAQSGAIYLDRAAPETQRKVTRLYQDSRTLDVTKQELADRFGYIFIDGGHDYETVKIDTQNALKMAKEDSVILWHDYRSAIHGDVTRFIDGEHSLRYPLYHVEHTMLVFQLNGAYRNLLQHGG